MTGYLHAGYCGSLQEVGTPVELPCAGGWILKREIPRTPLFDGMGSYPLFCCRDWGRLSQDLEEHLAGLVAVSLVADPFGNHTPELLRDAFPDRVIPFKEHFVIDLREGLDGVSRHHRRNARKALATVEVGICRDGHCYLEQWHDLYQTLIGRHAIRGIPVFSKESFRRQLRIPGVTLFRAVSGGETIGMLIWYRQDDVCYYHLGAYDERGYELGASFALFSTAIEHFREQGARWINLGAGAGLGSSAADGLTRFKSGWTRATRTAYFCGRIFDRVRYQELCHGRGGDGSRYFPAYRSGDFG